MNKMKKESLKVLALIAGMALSAVGFSQTAINIELEQSEKSGSQQCVSLKMSDPGSADHSLSSQNYRIYYGCLLYTSPSPRDKRQSRMPSSA